MWSENPIDIDTRGQLTRFGCVNTCGAGQARDRREIGAGSARGERGAGRRESEGPGVGSPAAGVASPVTFERTRSREFGICDD